MSSRNSKRKIDEEDQDGDILGAKQSKTDEGQTAQIGSSRSGRARKKSAKLLEMEAFEEEVASTTGKGRKKPVKTQEVDEIVTSVPVPPSAKKSPKAASRKKGKTVPDDVLAGISAPTTEVKIEVKQEVPAPEIKEESSLKLMLTMPTKQESGVSLPEDVMASPSESENDVTIKVEEPTPKSKAKKKTTKKAKTKPVKEEEPQQVVSPTVLKSPEAEVKPMKTELSDQDEEIVAVDDLPEEAPLVVAEKSTKKKKAPTKKKVKKPEPTGLQPALLHFDPEMSEKMEMLDYSEFVDTVTGMKEEVDVVTEEEIKTPPAAIPKKKAPAKKKSPPKTDSKKKSPASVQKAAKGKKKAPALNPDKTPKRRTTAYTLWCNNMRKQLMLQYPDSDFAHISRKLAELWQTVSVADKDQLRKKAKKIQKKQDMGKDVPVNTLPVSTHMRSGQQQQIPQHQIERSRMVVYTQPPLQQTSNYNYKITGNAPIDVAAHLKLLGESLGTIGARLQEHRGQIAVQGSLSVLLDSMLCALGPLMCLTNQVPELNTVPTHIHKRTLDNIAYIMPGIG